MTINCAKGLSISRVERWATSHAKIANAACGVGQHHVWRWNFTLVASPIVPFFDSFFVKDFSIQQRLNQHWEAVYLAKNDAVGISQR